MSKPYRPTLRTIQRAEAAMRTLGVSGWRFTQAGAIYYRNADGLAVVVSLAKAEAEAAKGPVERRQNSLVVA